MTERQICSSRGSKSYFSSIASQKNKTGGQQNNRSAAAALTPEDSIPSSDPTDTNNTNSRTHFNTQNEKFSFGKLFAQISNQKWNHCFL